VATAIALVFARTSSRAMLVVGALSLAALLPPWIVRERVFAIGRTLWGYVVDVSLLDVRLPNSAFAWFGPAPDGLGNMHVGRDGTLENGTAIKSLLQSAPILALSALATYGRTGVRGRALVCLLPAAGIAAELALNARFPGGAAISFPYLFPRYVVPAVPMLAVLAVGAVRELPWRKLDVVPSVLVAAAGLAFFLPQVDDGHWDRRFVELRLTLVVVVVAVAAAIAAKRRPEWSRVACLAVSAAFGAGVAVSLGVDTRILTRDLAVTERRVVRFAQLAPQRFALTGWGPDTDPILALRADRDIEYVDFSEGGDDWVQVREVLDRWAAEGRPVFGAFPKNVFRLPYPDSEVRVEVVDAAESFVRIEPARKK
jgi:hypothetical protein